MAAKVVTRIGIARSPDHRYTRFSSRLKCSHSRLPVS